MVSEACLFDRPSVLPWRSSDVHIVAGARHTLRKPEAVAAEVPIVCDDEENAR